jgi:hypothetical protein
MIGLVLAAGLALGARPAQIVKPGEEAAYAAWLETEVRAAAASFAGTDCSAAVLQPLGSLPLEDIVARQHPEIFFWQELVRIRGCGPADTQELVILRNGATWRAIRMAPGRSAAGPTLQKDILNNVAMAGAVLVRRADPTCAGDALTKSFRLVNTQVNGKFVSGAPWSERWTVHACKDDYSVDVALSPASDGGTDIRISDPGAKPAP